MALITDCPTIIVHAGKHYKVFIDSGPVISLIRYSMHQTIDNSFKTPIQTITTKLNMADGPLMMALGITALHLRIVDFKFTHNIILCNRPLDTEILFGIDIQKNFSYHTLGMRKKPTAYKRMADFSLTLELVNRRQQ